MKQGRSTLARDEAGRVLDKIALLEQVIGPELVKQALQDTACFDCRACKLTREVTLWVVLAAGILTDLPIRQVFKFARTLLHGEPTPHRSSLCIARQRLGLAPVRRLFELLVRPLANSGTRGAFHRDLRMVAIDATVLNVPDSHANARAFGRCGGSRGESAFPQVRKLSLIETGTHAELAFVVRGVKGAGSGETSMVPALLKHLHPGMLLLWDRAFFGFSLWKQALERGVEILGRAPLHAVLTPFTHLDDGSYLAKIYPCHSMRNRDEGGIIVRVIRYTIDDPQRAGHQQPHVLITSLLDVKLDPARDLVMLYHERWESELVYDEQKTHQNPRRAEKPAHLRSETPLGVMQEIYTLSMAHYAVRKVMHEAALAADIDPDRLSFLGTLRILRARMPECRATTLAEMAMWYRAVLREISDERTEPRRNRINPRVVKQKMSKFEKKKPEHRPIPPLNKTFEESLVVFR